MEIKDLIGLSLLSVATLVGIVVACLSVRARDAAFFLMTTGAVITHKLDINFFSQEWYRGTTRGLEYSFVDVFAISVLASSLLAPRQGQIRWFWPASLGLMLIFFCYACLSVVTSEPRIYGVFELSKMVRGLVFFLAAAAYVRGRRELMILMAALCCVVWFEGALAMRQRFLYGVYRATGSLEHENSFSMYLCLVSPLFVAALNSNLPRWLKLFSAGAIGFAAVGVVLTISRAGIPIFAMVMLGATAFCISRRITLAKIAGAGLTLLGVAAILYGAWDSLKLRYSQATFEQEYLDDNLEGRGHYLRLAMLVLEDRFMGVGLNNWSYWISKDYGARLGLQLRDYDDLEGIPDKGQTDTGQYAAPAHNLAALTAGELGVPGLILFGLLWIRWFWMGFRFLWYRSPEIVHRLGVGLFFGTCGIFLQSITEWTFRQTHIYITFHLLMGVLASLCWLKKSSRFQKAEVPLMDAEIAQPSYHEPDTIHA
jgi:hypothetical protein